MMVIIGLPHFHHLSKLLLYRTLWNPKCGLFSYNLGWFTPLAPTMVIPGLSHLLRSIYYISIVDIPLFILLSVHLNKLDLSALNLVVLQSWTIFHSGDCLNVLYVARIFFSF